MSMIKKTKLRIKERLRKKIKSVYRWIMQTGDVRAAEKGNMFVNDIKYNFSIADNLDSESKRIMVAQMFYHKIGYYPNIENPKTFSEKILWLKLYYKDPLIKICSDKVHGKEYINRILGDGYTVPILKKYDNVCDIDLDELPDKFVLKVNWCTGYNIIVTDKTAINLEAIKAKLDFWQLPWKTSYYGSFNWGYKDMKHIVFAEEYLEIPNNSTEYKLFCFNGKVNFVLVELDYFGKEPSRAYYDRDWSELPFKMERIKKVSNIDKPDTFEKMVKIAERLAKPFPHVRIDFYDIKGKLYVGEMTFYSGGGFTRITPQSWDMTLGDQLDISYAMQKMSQVEEKRYEN